MSLQRGGISSNGRVNTCCMHRSPLCQCSAHTPPPLLTPWHQRGWNLRGSKWELAKGPVSIFPPGFTHPSATQVGVCAVPRRGLSQDEALCFRSSRKILKPQNMVMLTLILQTLQIALMTVHFIIKLLDNINTFWKHLILYVTH